MPLSNTKGTNTSPTSPNWDDPLQAAIPSQTQPETAMNIVEQEKPADAFKLQALPPVRMEDKRVVNGEADVNQLAPFKYPWAWQYFLNCQQKPLDTLRHQYVTRRS